MAFPKLMYGSEWWALTNRSLQRKYVVEMRFLKPVKGCTRLDKITNHDTKSELGIYKLNEKIQINKSNWLQPVERMEDSHCRNASWTVNNYEEGM
jgi:hypothetical protein